jgi:hypothetical protein
MTNYKQKTVALGVWAASTSVFAAPPEMIDSAQGLRVAQASAEANDSTPTRRAAPARAFRPVSRFGIDDVLAEGGRLSSDAPEARHLFAWRLSPYALWQPSRNWEFRAGLRLDGATQRGGALDDDRTRADLADTYVRYRDGDMRLTVGAQTIVWGRVDAVPVIDRVSRVDLTRFILDDLAERRRAQWALRWEQTFGDDLKLDAVVLPKFRPARLPSADSVWHPINRLSGRIIGIEPDPALAALVQNAPLRHDDHGAGGAAVRLTRTGGAMDWGVTLARTRQPLPYVRLDGGVPALTVTHPYNNFIGVDAETNAGGATWRAELGYSQGVPATRPTGQTIETSAVEAVAGVEVFPGGKNTRLTLQLAARSLRSNGPMLELKDYVGVNGEIESTFAQGRWRASLRFMSGLNVHDVYVAPKLSYLGWEPHEVYITARHFAGEGRALGGFHRDHGMVAVGLRTRF